MSGKFVPPNKPLPAIPKKSFLQKMKVNSSKFLDKIPKSNPNLGQKTIISDLQKNKAGQILPELRPRPKKQENKEKKELDIMKFFGGKKSLKKRTKRKRGSGGKSPKRRTKKRKAKRTKKRRSQKRRKRKTRRR